MILGIETSCDDTAVALVDASYHRLIAHQVHSQLAQHERYGGVVPELAARDHYRALLPLIENILAGRPKTDLKTIAYTAGPGLMGALLVGASFGATLAAALGIPAIPIHHLEGHLLAPMLSEPAPTFPFLCLLVSGGHTLLAHVKALGDYKILGESVDDAAGEAFDKTAKCLGLPYPGGPALARLAEEGDPQAFRFPRPMLDRPGFDFSFSGLKTSAWQACQKNPHPNARKDLAASFEAAVVDTLCEKTKRCLQETGLTSLVIAGGVSANKKLRAQMAELAKTQGVELFLPETQFCTDNAAMIALAGSMRLAYKTPSHDLVIHARPRWPLDAC